MVSRCEVEIQIAGHPVVPSVWFAEIPEQCLLVMDFLCDGAAVIDLGTASLKLSGLPAVPLSFSSTPLAAEQCLEKMKVIEPSESPWASTVVLVPKKHGNWQFCVDFRWLNDVTTKDSYPLAQIDESLDQVASSQWFSFLDLRSGYWQVPLCADARPKTAFTTGSGLWQFKTMRLGHDLVITRIAQAGLKLHPEKCKLLSPSSDISTEGMVQEEPKEEPAVVQCRAILPHSNLAWAAEQQRDPDLLVVIGWLESGQRPSWESTAAHGLTELNTQRQVMGGDPQGPMRKVIPRPWSLEVSWVHLEVLNTQGAAWAECLPTSGRRGEVGNVTGGGKLLDFRQS
ncbi:hypothetical protein ACEWY4_014114 [Coilia grayii]|uniref:ribonuclease H n=1 Tax=Coilia grayii TaxID=363190 RepID=A0ABD1JRC9_9TELE